MIHNQFKLLLLLNCDCQRRHANNEKLLIKDKGYVTFGRSTLICIDHLCLHLISRNSYQLHSKIQGSHTYTIICTKKISRQIRTKSRNKNTCTPTCANTVICLLKIHFLFQDLEIDSLSLLYSVFLLPGDLSSPESTQPPGKSC